ncbi:hypothetical protein POJ06DRAFT_95888 [Lipomyces tetrasporus]|uniref:Uncharacterized protein n=1 Tax=Lipomyces tetrasporus TaxID=54092 RepID=A0AAD7VSS3_9ASCO|nr:uncharacterized protein POJ06DRAFT_95888 [Lipomyces tetrasporus]KAJ8101392.1 hypothetical protein POJ06DRAFT_95888 [Lipomyces tetrasporus]
MPNDNKLARKLFRQWKYNYRVRRHAPPSVTSPLIERRGAKPATKVNRPVWFGSNKEYGISDRELLDIYLSQKYKVDVSPASQTLRSTIQLPNALTVPFQRKFFIRLLHLGGTHDFYREKTQRQFSIASQKNQTHATIMGGIYHINNASIFQSHKALYSWSRKNGLLLSYYPPYHHLGAFAKSRPAALVSESNKLKPGSVFRSTHRKKVRRYLFEAFCEVQGISRETLRWSDVTSFEPMAYNENLNFLLEDERNPEIINDELRRNQQDYGIQDEYESFLIKKDDNHIRGIDGLYVFLSREGHVFSDDELRNLMREAVKCVIYEYGYVNKEMHDEYAARTQTLNEQSELYDIDHITTKQPVSLEGLGFYRTALQKAYSRTSRPCRSWIYKRNKQFLESNLDFDENGRHYQDPEEWERLYSAAKTTLTDYQEYFLQTSAKWKKDQEI